MGIYASPEPRSPIPRIPVLSSNRCAIVGVMFFFLWLPDTKDNRLLLLSFLLCEVEICSMNLRAKDSCSAEMLLFICCQQFPFTNTVKKQNRKQQQQKPPNNRYQVKNKNNGEMSESICINVHIKIIFLSKQRKLDYFKFTKKINITIPNHRKFLQTYWCLPKILSWFNCISFKYFNYPTLYHNPILLHYFP